MRFGSVCSGIEAASVAWEPLGWKAAWFSEIEPFPSKVLAHHYPETPNLGDMTEIPALLALGEVEAPDILCGGTPCQAFSVAGLRRSLDDARGNLSLTFCEIANAIDHARAARGEQPCIVFWENVPGVLNTKDNAFGCFLAGLAGEDDPLVAPGGKWSNSGVVLGPQRAVAWRILDAQYFGLAQRRRRVFVVASSREGFDPAAVLLEWDGVRRDTAPSREAGKVAPTIPSRSTAGGGLGTDFDLDGGVVGTIGCNTGPNGHGFGDFLNNQAVDAGHIVPVAFGGNRTSGSIEITPALLAQPGSDWKGDFESETFLVLPVEPMFLHAKTSGGGRMEAVAHAMQVRRLTPRECERLQGFPDDYTAIPWRNKPASECPDGPRYKALGNSWAVPVVRWIGWRIDTLANLV